MVIFVPIPTSLLVHDLTKQIFIIFLVNPLTPGKILFFKILFFILKFCDLIFYHASCMPYSLCFYWLYYNQQIFETLISTGFSTRDCWSEICFARTTLINISCNTKRFTYQEYLLFHQYNLLMNLKRNNDFLQI